MGSSTKKSYIDDRPNPSPILYIDENVAKSPYARDKGYVVWNILISADQKDKLKFWSKTKIAPTTVSKKIEHPPLSFLFQMANLLPLKQRECLTQEISDMRLEYFEAVARKELGRARSILGFYYIGLVWSVLMWISDRISDVLGINTKKE